MLFVLSPAKSLDYDSPAAPAAHSAPLFMDDAAELIELLKTRSPQQIASLMGISDKLALLNVGRYAAWRKKATPDNARQAVLAFDGDVYDGLSARTLDSAQLDWAQQHLCILSGLYGVLRPLDLLQAYRLEMGTKLANARGSDLYQFWGSKIADYLNTRLAEQGGEPVLVNLASQEYFKAIDLRTLQARVVECVFEDEKDGKYKIISFFAKRARGLMMRYAIEQQVNTVEGLTGFDAAGYAWAPDASGPDRLVFRRRQADA
ncbi:MAG: peroxide stress protein YaaA [Brachymonas sp.]|nr:peroxide stress protein YaaA [Brachymonas sp.]